MPGISAYLQQMVEKSSGMLLDESARGTGEGLLFLGNPQLVFPRLLFEDPVLEPIDRNVWAAIKLAAADSGTVTAFPSYEELMLRCNVGSKATIARSISILRSTRWLTVCKASLRDGKGRIRGNIYALHDEPVQLAESMELDSHYLEWLEHTAQGRHTPHPRAVAVADLVLQGLHGLLASGEDITQLESPMKLRQDALEAIRMIRAGMAGAEPERRPDGSPLPNLHKRSVAGCIAVGKRGYLKGGTRVQKLYLDGQSGKTVLSTETVPGWKNGQNGTEYRNCTQPGTVSVLRSSKYVNKNTTTTVVTTEAGVGKKAELAWPSPIQQLDSNNRALVRMQLATIPEQHHPLVLEVLAAKLTAIADGKAKPLTFGILPYTRKLCELANEGKLNPVSMFVPTVHSFPGGKPVDQADMPTTLAADEQLRVLQGKISDYANEVRQLEALSRAAGVELSGLSEARDKWKKVSLNYQTLLQQQSGQVVAVR